MREARRFSLLRMLVVVAVLGAAVLVMAPLAFADHEDSSCTSSDTVNVPTHEAPHPDIPVVGKPLNGKSTCGDLTRTLIFVGSAQTSNGVNFAGVGGPQTCAAFDTGTDAPWVHKDGTNAFTHTSDGALSCPYETTSGVASGDYDFDGDCIMIDYDAVSLSVSGTSFNCGFDTAEGYYGAPTENDLDFGAEDGTYCHGPACGNADYVTLKNTLQGVWTAIVYGNASALDWDPDNEASCFGSNGTGYSTFTAQKDNGDIDTFRAHYTWQNGLTNLRGTNQELVDGSPSGPLYDFDAKTRVDADHFFVVHESDPQDASLVPGTGISDERTDAGCLKKNINIATNTPNTLDTGINTFQVIGTATWRLQLGVDA